MRRTRHRRRFHTDRIVRNRRARYLREMGASYAGLMDDLRRFSYGALADRDPWDCGGKCWLCSGGKWLDPRRAREGREWRDDWEV